MTLLGGGGGGKQKRAFNLLDFRALNPKFRLANSNIPKLQLGPKFERIIHTCTLIYLERGLEIDYDKYNTSLNSFRAK